MSHPRHKVGAAFTVPAVGVTGGIGSGKSMVCSIFAGLGRTVLSADPLARELMESDAAVAARLRDLLGGEVYRADGTLNRELVADRIFSDRRVRDGVNAIVHPAVFDAIRIRLDALSPAAREPYVVIEAALVYESGLDRFLRSVIVVDAPLEIRLARVVARDGARREDVVKRARSQMSTGEKIRRADFVIRNSGTPEQLAVRVRFIDSLLENMFVGG